MISETLAPFATAGIMVLLWGLVAFLWVLAHEAIEDNTGFGDRNWRPDLKDYAIAGLTIVVLSALTFVLLMWTLTLMGV